MTGVLWFALISKTKNLNVIARNPDAGSMTWQSPIAKQILEIIGSY
jgi:hypothetical protein